MITRNLLYKRSYAINEHINIIIPTIGEIIDCESAYYNLVYVLTAMPVDLMVQLDDVGIDFTAITDYDLFLIMFSKLKNQDTSLVFGDLDLKDFEYEVNPENQTVFLLNQKNNDIKIDRAIHGQITNALRTIHHIDKDERSPANAEAKEFMIERARKKLRRQANIVEASQLETLIVAMVNTEQFKYNFESVKNVSIYQFNESVRQVIKKVDYDNRMYGVYAGTIDAKELSQDDFNWLTHK